MRRRFMWRAGLAFGVFIAIGVGLTVLIGSIASWLTGTSVPVAAVVTSGLFLLVVALAFRRFRRAAAPVGDLVEAAARIEAGDYTARVAERGPREVRALAGAFNAMSARLEENDEARRRLLADVSHELRTPLTVMQGTLEGMLDGVYPADESHLAPVLEETRVLVRLVEDLRTLSLSEAGSLRLHLEPTDLGALLHEVVASHRAAADVAGVALDLHATDLPTVDVDPARIRQVVVNLVANALRFTPSGGSIAVDASAGKAEFEIAVSDTGRGMEPDAVKHAFDRFYRAQGSPGSGLGLSIARNLVEAHGGRIAIRSEPGAGTHVQFMLPVSSADGPPAR